MCSLLPVAVGNNGGVQWGSVMGGVMHGAGSLVCLNGSSPITGRRAALSRQQAPQGWLASCHGHTTMAGGLPVGRLHMPAPHLPPGTAAATKQQHCLTVLVLVACVCAGCVERQVFRADQGCTRPV